MTFNEILIALYLLIGCGVLIGFSYSFKKGVSTIEKIISSFFVGLLWIVFVPAKATQKLFE